MAKDFAKVARGPKLVNLSEKNRTSNQEATRCHTVLASKYYYCITTNTTRKSDLFTMSNVVTSPRPRPSQRSGSTPSRTPSGGRSGGRTNHHTPQQRQQQPQPQAMHRDSGLPFGHVPAFLPGSASLVEELDKRVMVVLRDGTYLFGVRVYLHTFAADITVV